MFPPVVLCRYSIDKTAHNPSSFPGPYPARPPVEERALGTREHTAHDPLIGCDEGPALEISAFESFYGLRFYVLSTWLGKPNFVSYYFWVLCPICFVVIGESHSLLFVRLTFLD